MVKDKQYKKSKVEKKKKDYKLKNMYDPEFSSSKFIHKNMNDALRRSATQSLMQNQLAKKNIAENNGEVQNSTARRMASKIK
jgi:hypothetical protein